MNSRYQASVEQNAVSDNSQGLAGIAGDGDYTPVVHSSPVTAKYAFTDLSEAIKMAKGYSSEPAIEY